PGCLALQHVDRCFRSAVAWTEARPAGCQHDHDLFGELDDRIRDRVALIGHDASLDLVALAREQLRQNLATLVLARPLGDAVRDGDDGRLHSFTFSSRRTSPISIAGSTPLAMS